MTVKNLIEQLQKFDSSMPVVIRNINHGYDDAAPITIKLTEVIFAFNCGSWSDFDLDDDPTRIIQGVLIDEEK